VVSLSLAIHRTLEMFLGMVLVLVLLLAALSTAVYIPAGAVVASVTIGALVLTVAVAGTRDQSALSPSTHVLADRLLVLALFVAAIGFASSGATAVAVFFLVVGVLEAALTFATRYAVTGRERSFDEPLQRPH